MRTIFLLSLLSLLHFGFSQSFNSSCISIGANCTTYFSGTIQTPYIVADNVVEIENQVTSLTSAVQQLELENAQLAAENTQLQSEVDSLSTTVSQINTNPYLVAESFGCDASCLKPSVTITSPGGASTNCYTNLTSCGTNAYCASNGKCMKARVMFTTTGALTGNFVSSSATYCNTQAYQNPALQTKQFVPVYCGPDYNAINTKPPFLYDDTVPVVNVQGGLIAGSAYQMLHATSLIGNLNMDQHGQALPSNRYAWTGTFSTQTCANTCSGWASSSSSQEGNLGNPRRTEVIGTYSWKSDHDQACSLSASLYCLEVD